VKQITDLGIAQLSDAYRAGRLDPLAVTHDHLERISSLDAAIRSYLMVAREPALAAAARSSERWRRGRPIGALDGIPVALKDNIDVAGLPCTAGVEAFRHRVPTLDAPAYRRLHDAGAVVLGKLNMHEAALGGTTDNRAYGRCINPLMPDHTPGGSSGGSGAAVAAGLCVAALGTDTMGSVRVPASYCGVYGYKPSHAAISTAGVVPLSFTLDTVGPLARSAADLEVLAATLLQAGDRLAMPPICAWRGLRIGRPRQLDSVDLQSAVAAAFENLLQRLAREGADIVNVDLPAWDPPRARRAGLLVTEAEGAAFWERQLGTGLGGLSGELAAMLRYPATAGLAKIIAAYELIEAVRVDCRRAFADVDLLALPTTPQTCFAHNGVPPVNQADCTALANFARAPALAFPLATGGLPASAQLLAAPEQDRRLLALAAAIDGLRD
jgi:aspartyl-tRNA(Asn)/glutamyl-tRNA(Gln) amidotransferase subunit A